MKFDTPAGSNPIDQLRVVSRAVDRIDGPMKVSGRAPYAYERHDVAPNAAYGVVVGAGIARGRITAIDQSAAGAAPGVLAIVTAENAGKLTRVDRNTANLLAGPNVDHYHQAVALVVAETFEQARAAANLLRVSYAATPGEHDLAAAKASTERKTLDRNQTVGDFAGAFAQAEVRVDETYTTPGQSHAMMEPNATTAVWHGDRLSVWTSHQMVDWAASDLAQTLGMPRDKLHLMSPFVGGGFGAKLFLRADAVLAAVGARIARRAVKVALQRPLMANNLTHRPATIQRVRLGATRQGVLTAIAHESWSGNLAGGKPENAVQQTLWLYAGANRLTGTRLALIDLPEGNAMRAPGEAPGHLALEAAMDELAEKLAMDPIALRVLNDTQVDPANPARPFSDRRLIECMRLGAERFGWARRSTRPAQRREGRHWIGMGMAAAFRNNQVTKSGARVRIDARGGVTVETDMTDIGTGSYTVIAQTAAEMMGVPLARVAVRLGDSSYPVSAGSGGQWGGNCSTAGIYAACVKLREAVLQRAGLPAEGAMFADGMVRAGGRSLSLAEAAGPAGLAAEDTIEFEGLSRQYQQSTFGAHFIEVAVDAFTAEVRIRRMLAVCSSGRILNPKTARSQVIGAMTMGAGAALMEELAVDKRRGFFVNHDLAGYEVPVHADMPHQEVIFLNETDPISSPMKAKGVGELGICGVGAAVANAVYNATGVRVRDYPLTLDKLIAKMPSNAA